MESSNIEVGSIRSTESQPNDQERHETARRAREYVRQMDTAREVQVQAKL